MRTSTAAWAAALAVMSISGPFTTAKAAPARAHAADERPRPFYAKLRKRQGFNDSDSDTDNSKSPLVPLLGGKSTSSSVRSDPAPSPDPSASDSKDDPTQSDPNLDPTSLVVSILGGADSTTTRTPLTTSTSEPLDKEPPSKSSDSGPDPIGSLLTTLLEPTTTSLAQPTGQSDDGPDRDASTTTPTNTDPLLGSITGQLSNVLPTPSSSGTIVVGITTVLHQTTDDIVPTLPGTGALNSIVPTLPGTGNSGPETTQSGLLGSIVPSILPTGTRGVLPSGGLNSIVPSLPGTGNSGPDATTTHSDILGSIVSSVLPTGNVGPILSGPVVNPSNLPSLPAGGRPIGTGLSGLPGTDLTKSVLSTVDSIITGITQPGSVIPTITGTGGLTIPQVTPTGGIPGVVSSVKPIIPSNVPSVPSGLTGPVTNPVPTTILNPTPIVSSILSETTPNLTATVDSITSKLSQTGSVAPIVTAGTGTTPIPTGSTFTVTDGDTSVIVTVSDNSAANTATASAPVATASNETESNKPSDASQRPVASQTATTNETTAIRTGSNTPNTPSTSVQATPAASTTRSVQPQVSIVATGTDTQTTLSLPTTWSFAPSSPKNDASGTEVIASATTSTDTSSGFPTAMPRLVQPANGMPSPPSGFSLVQVGFTFGLNYPFVVGKPESASQIFAYLPQGIAYGLGIPKENVLMNALMPYDTSQTLGYITTLAQTYIPTELVNEMQLHLHLPTSPIYLNPSAPVSDLMNMVNPTIPIQPGANMDGYSSSSAYNPAATTRAGEGDGAPIGGDSGSAKKVSGASVGIGLGAIGGAAVYAAAMIYVARRYRQKRKGHQRASSVPTAGGMTQRSSGGGMGTLFMSGANGRVSPRTLVTNSGGRNSRTSNGSSNGRSVREQGISAPLMSENSLGWD